LVPVNESTEIVRELSVAREPTVVLEEARKAAAALKDVIGKKSKPVIMNGEQYLEFEDWQTVARFYGVSAKVVSTNPVQLGDVIGFEARAVAYHIKTDQEISAADAMCLNDEPKWSMRAKYEYRNNERVKVGEEPVPLFQLRSMAQTRACAKALRNCLAWVVVLAGYKPTPAEEMTGEEHRTGNGQQQQDVKLYEQTESHQKLRAALLAHTKNDGIKAADILKELTTWAGKDGVNHEGKKSLNQISEKMAQIALKTFNEQYKNQGREPGQEG
jgi:hypothetical protein